MRHPRDATASGPGLWLARCDNAYEAGVWHRKWSIPPCRFFAGEFAIAGIVTGVPIGHSGVLL
jgi:hypothetical protein